MALATSLAAALAWSAVRWRTAVVIALAVTASTAVLADEQVYIWRDQSGAVRFSAVESPIQPAEARQTESETVAAQCLASVFVKKP